MGREGNGRKGRGTQVDRKGREERGGEGTGREGTSNILLHPQFQFSRNMPALSHYDGVSIHTSDEVDTFNTRTRTLFTINCCSYL